jgi:hypothetical protein
VLIAEQKLPIEIAQVDRVEVNDMDLAEACEDEVLEKLTADAASSDHENARLKNVQRKERMAGVVPWERYLLDTGVERPEALAGIFVACHCAVDGPGGAIISCV